MRTSLNLQLSLYRSQKAQIAQAVAGSSAAFRAYEQRYRNRTRTYQRAVTATQVGQAVRKADLVYVGDYHTLRSAQQSYLSLVEEACREPGRRVVLALEFVEGRHQAAVDAFMAGKIGERTFLDRIDHPYGGAFDIWPGFSRVFELARHKRLQVVAIDKRSSGPSSLPRRDAYAAARIAEQAAAPDRPKVMVLMGQYHIAPCHLPAAVDERLGEQARRSLVVYQNCDAVWWSLARKGRIGKTHAVQIRKGELCLIHTSPLVCQQSFLDYLEAESGDAPLAEDGATERVRHMAKLIGRFVGVQVGRHLPELCVGTPADGDFLERVGQRAQFSRRELEQVRRQILDRESYYLPRARMVWLASLSLNHAAEEAAHFVRHCAIGSALETSFGPADAFYARCVEEALGFFGSRLVNPHRRCEDVPDWAATFRRARGERRQIAAFLLAHKAAEAEGPEEAAKLVPLRQERLFHAVSHGLGYLLGDKLHRAFEARRLSRAAVRRLFAAELTCPRTTYFELLRRAEG
jgi:hypothetical protein